jgi:hypothetical protein
MVVRGIAPHADRTDDAHPLAPSSIGISTTVT